MTPILALALKDMKHLVRDKSAAFFTFVFPLLIAMFFGVIFGGGGESSALEIAMVDEDGTEASKAFVTDLAGDSALHVTGVATRSDGEALVRRGKAVASIVVPKGFGESADGMFGGGTMKVEGVVDPSRRAESGLLTGKLNQIAFQQMSRTFSDVKRMGKALDDAKRSIGKSEMSLADKALFGLMFDSIERVNRSTSRTKTGAEGETTSALAGWMPVKVELGELREERATPRSSYDISFTQGVIWGLMGCVTAFGVSLASERARGTFMRLMVAPITRGQVLAGKALGCFLCCLIVQVMLLAFGVMVFKVRIGNPAMMAVVCVVAAVGFTGVMMLMAGLSRSEGGGAAMGRALILVLAMIGGGTVPMFLMPPFMQTVSKISPFSWATIALEGAIWRQFTAAEMMIPAAVLLVFGVAGFALGTFFLSWSTDTSA